MVKKVPFNMDRILNDYGAAGVCFPRERTAVNRAYNSWCLLHATRLSARRMARDVNKFQTYLLLAMPVLPLDSGSQDVILCSYKSIPAITTVGSYV